MAPNCTIPPLNNRPLAQPVYDLIGSVDQIKSEVWYNVLHETFHSLDIQIHFCTADAQNNFI